MATLDVKFSKFDNRPWGFRLAGGSDFPQPLTVIRVSEGGLAECMGLKVGDVVVQLNDQPINELTHGQAHEALTLAGNNFVLGVRRTEDPSKSIEGFEEKIEPYMLPIEEILFAPIEEKKESSPDEVEPIQDESELEQEPEEEVEEYPEKPRDENSEIVPNTKLTDEEIALLILDQEEVLDTNKGVLGVNFKKLRPRAPLLKESKVFQELQKEIDQEPAPVQELKHQTTFLQKPDRPVPKTRSRAQSEEAKPEPEPEPYKVVIKKQPKKSVAERLVEKGLLEPSRVKTPETTQASEVNDLEPDCEPLSSTEPTETSVSPLSDLSISDLEYQPESLPDCDTEPESPLTSPKGIWSFTSYINEVVLIIADEEEIKKEIKEKIKEEIKEDNNEMLPINESFEDIPSTPTPTIVRTYDEMIPTSFIAAPAIRKPTKRPRLCRRGRYAKRCLDRALESLKSPTGKTKPRLLRRGHYFERIVRDVKQSLSGEKEKEPSYEESFLRLLMFASLANSLRDTYDTEILHRGSSRRNSRRLSYRRDSNAVCPLENGFFAYKPTKEQESMANFTTRCAEGRRRLSVMSMVVADKVTNAIRSDIARGVAYALVPCASALAFFMYNYIKRINDHE